MARQKWLLVPVIAWLLISCGPTRYYPTRQVVGPDTTQSLVPYIHKQMTRTAVVEKIGPGEAFADRSAGILIYYMAKRDADVLQKCEFPYTGRSHQLVLIFDEHDRLKRYSLIKAGK